jgi:hypothetical protein
MTRFKSRFPKAPAFGAKGIEGGGVAPFTLTLPQPQLITIRGAERWAPPSIFSQIRLAMPR